MTEDFRRPRSSRQAIPLDRRRVRLSAALVVFSLLAASCATLAPGADPIVVRAEQALEVSLAVYDAGMVWSRGHADRFSPDALKVVNGVRTGFPPAYRSLDASLQLYKATKAGTLATELDEVDTLIRQLVEAVKLAGGPDLMPAPPPAGGAK